MLEVGCFKSAKKTFSDLAGFEHGQRYITSSQHWRVLIRDLSKEKIPEHQKVTSSSQNLLQSQKIITE